MALLRRGDQGQYRRLLHGRLLSSAWDVQHPLHRVNGVPPSEYRRTHAEAAKGMPPCVAKQVTRPIRIEKRLPVRAQPA